MLNQITITERLRDAFSRHKVLFLLSLVLVSGITTSVVLLRGKNYQATASTQVVTDNQQVADTLGDRYRNSNFYISSAQQQLNHFNDLIEDDLPGGFWDSALKSANLAVPIDINPRAKDPRFALLKKQLYTEADSATMFTIGLKWNNADECERIVTALQKQYNDQVSTEQQIRSVGTNSFLKSELDKLEKRLQAAEGALSQYRSQHSGALPNAQAAENDNLAVVKQQRDELEVTARDSQETIKAVQAMLATTPAKIVAEQLLENSSSATLLNQLRAQRTTLLAQGLSPTGTKLAPLNEQITQLEKSVDAEKVALAKSATEASRGGSGTSVSQTRLTDNPQYLSLKQQLLQAQIEGQSAVQRLATARKQVADYEKRIAQIPLQERELTKRTRDYDLLKQQYDELKLRQEQANIKSQLDQITASDTLQPVGAVYAIPTQSASKNALMVVGSLILGLVIATGMVVLAEWNDPTLRYPEDVERFLDLPVLAAVPELAAIDTSDPNSLVAPPGMLPGEMGTNAGVHFGKNTGGLASRNPSMGAFGR